MLTVFGIYVSRFHALLFVLYQLHLFAASSVQIFPIFYGYVTPWRCQHPPLNNETRHTHPQRSHRYSAVDFSDHGKQAAEKFSKNCTVFETCPKRNLVRKPSPFNSTAMEYNLFCDRAYYLTTVTTVQILGTIIGGMVAGQAADLLGRKKVAILLIALTILGGFFCAGAIGWKTFAVTRFFVGMTTGGFSIVFFALAMEHVLPNQRILLSIFCNTSWTRMWFTAICWLFGTWRLAQIGATCILIPVLLAVVIFVPESYMWCIAKGRYVDAEKSQKHIARMNGLPYEPDEHDREEKGADTGPTNVKDLFATKRQVLETFVFFADRYLPGCSRRKLFLVPLCVCMVCFALSAVLLQLQAGILITVVNIFGLIFVDYSHSIAYVLAAETFDTRIRASAVAVCSFSGRVGQFAAVQVLFLREYWKPGPFAVVTIVDLICLSVSYKFLRETKGIDLANVHQWETCSSVEESVEEEKQPMLEKRF